MRPVACHTAAGHANFTNSSVFSSHTGLWSGPVIEGQLSLSEPTIRLIIPGIRPSARISRSRMVPAIRQYGDTSDKVSVDTGYIITGSHLGSHGC